MSLTNRILISLALMALAGFAILLNPILDRVERQYLEATEEPMVDVAEILAALLSNQPHAVGGARLPEGSRIRMPAPFRVPHSTEPQVIEAAGEGAEPNGESGGDLEPHLRPQLNSTNLLAPDAWRVGMEAAKAKSLNAKIYNLMKDKVLMDFYITDADGVIVYDSGEAAELGDDFSIYNDVSKTLAGKYGARSSRTDEEDSTSSVMYVGAPIMDGDEIIGVLSVYKPQRSMLLFIIETKRRLVTLGLVAVGTVLLLGWLLSKWVTYPLRRLTDYAAAVAQGERPPAPQMPGKHLRILAETTEAMREALENRKYVESYVQSLTHEMKSPVAGIRGAAELLYEDLPEAKRVQFLGNIQSESLRLQNLIDQLLALASLENRTVLGTPTRMSLSALARRVVNHHESGALEKRIHFEVEGAEKDWVLGEEFLLETALSNLVQNAADFSPADATVKVEVRVSDDWVEVRVSDEGKGIPEYAVGRIFDRFYSLPRPGSERKSSGLGLCFTREAVQLHGGTLAICNRTDRSGVEAVIALPEG